MRDTIQRGGRFLAAVILCLWTIAALAAGADMLAVWAGRPDDVDMAIWQRLGLLATVAVAPPLLLWALWRLGIWMTGAAQLRWR